MLAAMAKSKGMGSDSKPSMGMGKKMPMGYDEDEDSDMEQEENDPKAGKMMALQNLLGAISELSDEEIRPDIEKMKSQLQMQHESAESPEYEAKEHEGQDMDEMGGMGAEGKKPALDVTIGMGGMPPKKPGEEDEDEESPKAGFLAILSKKLNKKPSK